MFLPSVTRLAAGKNRLSSPPAHQAGDDWDKYGCEDPRVTKMDGKYYIFYTALSRYPFTADGIKVGVAVTRDFKTVEKHQVTTFNSKAMAMFPSALTVNTPRYLPPILTAAVQNRFGFF